MKPQEYWLLTFELNHDSLWLENHDGSRGQHDQELPMVMWRIFFLTYTCVKRSTVSKRKTLFLKSSVLRTFICHDCHILSSSRKSRMCCDFGGRTEGKLAASWCAVDALWEERDPVHHVCTDMTWLSTWRFCFLAPTGDAALFKGSCETHRHGLH